MILVIRSTTPSSSCSVSLIRLRQITVTALSPLFTLKSEDARAEWDRVLRELQQDGARPRRVRLYHLFLAHTFTLSKTEHGTLMVTSLANFRSDYTIVPVPSGVFLDARDLLYTNINLLRMGCSGRMALTLQEPRRAQFQQSVSFQKE